MSMVEEGCVLSPGARRALLKHRRDDGGLSEHVLGKDDAEELWFCSMLSQIHHGIKLVTREAWTGGDSIVWSYTLTEEGKRVRAAALRDA
jgi:hypothetical protein